MLSQSQLQEMVYGCRAGEVNFAWLRQLFCKVAQPRAGLSWARSEPRGVQAGIELTNKKIIMAMQLFKKLSPNQTEVDMVQELPGLFDLFHAEPT